jgi:two-component system KDP operon response regulator KdpE/two-component system response regulator VicR/OmpR family response regulator RpaB
MARIRAVLRRSQTLADSAEPDELICGNIKLVPASREVTVRDIGIDLSPREYQLLDRLLRRPDRAISYRNLLASA